jgi:hypothetical protein
MQHHTSEDILAPHDKRIFHDLVSTNVVQNRDETRHLRRVAVGGSIESDLSSTVTRTLTAENEDAPSNAVVLVQRTENNRNAVEGSGGGMVLKSKQHAIHTLTREAAKRPLENRQRLAQDLMSMLEQGSLPERKCTRDSNTHQSPAISSPESATNERLSQHTTGSSDNLKSQREGGEHSVEETNLIAEEHCEKAGKLQNALSSNSGVVVLGNGQSMKLTGDVSKLNNVSTQERLCKSGAARPQVSSRDVGQLETLGRDIRQLRTECLLQRRTALLWQHVTISRHQVLRDLSLKI